MKLNGFPHTSTGKCWIRFLVALGSAKNLGGHIQALRPRVLRGPDPHV
jgi:hypothetical protein